MKRFILGNNVVYILPLIAWDKRHDEYNTLYIGWFTFLYYKNIKR